MKTNLRRGSCPKRCNASVKIPWKGALVKVERIPLPKPRRDEPSRDIAKQYPDGQWMHCAKLLAQSVMARDFGRQDAENKIRAAILNSYTALGILETVALA